MAYFEKPALMLLERCTTSLEGGLIEERFLIDYRDVVFMKYTVGSDDREIL